MGKMANKRSMRIDTKPNRNVKTILFSNRKCGKYSHASSTEHTHRYEYSDSFRHRVYTFEQKSWSRLDKYEKKIYKSMKRGMRSVREARTTMKKKKKESKQRDREKKMLHLNRQSFRNTNTWHINRQWRQ